MPDGHRRSKLTWKQIAHSLVSWLEFCRDIVEINWADADRSTMILYRDTYLHSISPTSGESYSSSTVKIRMLYAMEFYDFCRSKGWYRGNIASETRRRASQRAINREPLYHLQKGDRGAILDDPGPRLLPKTIRTDRIKVLSKQELKSLLACCGPRVSERSPMDQGLARDRLIVDLGWAVGLRKEEIAGLSIYPFLDTIVGDQLGRLFPFSIVGKGSVARTVDIPGWLVIDVQAYITGERKRALAKRGAPKEKRLLLCRESHRRAGHPMTSDAIGTRVEVFVQDAGLLRSIEVIDPDSGKKTVKQTHKFSTHSLRHTYACMQYVLRKEMGDPSPWTYIQCQLGHRFSSTTLNTYLRYVHLWSDARPDLDLLDALRR